MKENKTNSTNNSVSNNEVHENVLEFLSLSREQRAEAYQRMTKLVERWAVSPESLTPDERSRVEGILRRHRRVGYDDE